MAFVLGTSPAGAAVTSTASTGSVAHAAGVGRVTTPAVREGSFVVVRGSGAVYRVVGGAPVYVSSWTPFGGPQPVTPISAAQLSAMPLTPADGTFVVAGQRGDVYRFAGGAPLYVSSWTPFGGPQAVTAVDAAALDNAGGGGVWNHVRAMPADGTFVVGAGPSYGHVYRFAGGAPVYVSSWGPFGGPQRFTAVDHAALDLAGSGGPWNHARYTPADGTYLHGAQTGKVYEMRGGMALYVADWSHVGGPKPTTAVDQVAIDLAGLGLTLAHIRGVDGWTPPAP